MNNVPDYIKIMGATLKPEVNLAGSCYLYYKNSAAIFFDIELVELRQKFNDAMHFAVGYYTHNKEKNNVNIKENQIQDLSFIVVLETLRLFSLWRHNSEQYKDLPLRIEEKDLLHPQSQDQVWFYCKKEFGHKYTTIAAGLLDMTVDEFFRYMEGRNLYFDIH